MKNFCQIANLSAFTLALFAANLATGQTYRLDPSSQFKFNVRNFGITSVDGTFKDFSGEIILNESPEKSTVSVEVKTASIDTQNEERDKHLRTADFFDVEKFPKMFFKSTGLKGTREKFMIDGDLTIRNSSSPVAFSCLQSKESDGALDYSCETELNRQKFGLNHGSTISDRVTVELKIHAVKKSAIISSAR